MSLVDEVLAAHGGLERWQAAEAVSLRFASGGIAFSVKGQRTALHEVEATVVTTGQRVELRTPSWSRTFAGAFAPPRRRWRWCEEDIAAFAATAIWTYVSLPFRLPELDVAESGRRLHVRFPPSFVTHSPEQVLHVGDDGLLRRHDYTALAFGRWAQATQTLDGYVRAGGLAFPTRRRVRPRWWPHTPLLVWIDVASVAVEPAGAPYR